MKWLDSNPVKLLNFLATLATLITAIGSIELKGEQWGMPLSAAVGAGAVVLPYLAFLMFLELLKHRRNCPRCRGTGQLGAYPDTVNRCDVCNGKGKLWL